MHLLYIFISCFIIALICKLIWKSIKLVFNILLILFGLGILSSIIALIL